MSGDMFSRSELGYGPNDLSVLRQKRVAFAIKHLRVAGRKALFQQLYAMAAKHNLPIRRPTEPHKEVRNPRGLCLHPMNQPFGNGGRCLQRLIRHQIQNGNIPCMADAGQYRQLELRANGAELVVIEA